MLKSIRLGATLTAIGLVGALAACSTPGSKTAMRGTTLFGKKIDTANIALGSRAQLALAANDVAGATALAERAVENSPNDAGFRALLGNCYLAAGRFASAEAAYGDSLSLIANQPQVALKLALVQIALGKTHEAVALLSAARNVIDPADTGLALALAGRTDDAVAVLEPAARAIGADSRLRQNLALAYALGGNWETARTIAAQDVPADQLDGRIQQWMVLAKPGQSGSKVASFIGITPSAADPGQPTRLALQRAPSAERYAQAGPVVSAPAAAPVMADVPVAMTAPLPAPAIVAPTAPMMAAASVTPVYVAPPAPVAEPEPVAIAIAEPEPTPVAIAPAPVKVAPAPAKVAAKAPAPASLRTARPALTPAATKLSQSLPEIRKAAMVRPVSGRSKAVVQLGAYSSRERIETAWNRASGKFAQLRNFQPVTARFDGAQGTVYRLSVKGFDSDREAVNLCVSLKRAGGNCFVRAVSGDAPVRFASR